MSFGSMEVAEFELEPEEWGDESDPRSDWSLANQFATFQHTDACEFIFYIGKSDNDGGFDAVETLEAQGFSKEFLERCKRVQKAGYKYVCFHT